MRAHLLYGARYRARVHVDPLVRAVLTAGILKAELQRYQLYGEVREADYGYEVTADFLGASGVYDVPEAVKKLDIIG